MTNSFQPGNAIRADALNENFDQVLLSIQELEGKITNPTGTMTGPQGPAGAQGQTGATGATGSTGPAGPTGATGATGAQGATGTAGTQGPIGPAGPTGAPGSTGATGPQGEMGTGLKLLGSYAYTGAPNTGTTGATPSQGDLWKASDNNCWAYNGTSWTNVGAISGATGAQGATGATGTTGATGPQGATGAAGAQGATGPAGPQGIAGVQGPKGDTGATGAAGATGPQGSTGLQGPSGTATTMESLTNVSISNLSVQDRLEYDGTTWLNKAINESDISYTTVANVAAIPNFTVDKIVITNGGSGYSSTPTVTITNTSGSTGSGATATATISGSKVTDITITAPGSGYSAGATIAFSGGGGTGAAATATTDPTNGSAIEVTDSSGIQSFTPMSGMPSGFTGDSGLSVRLQYDTSGTDEWKWRSYFANTPETRYASIAGETFTGAVNLDENITVKNGKEVRISEETSNGSNYIALKAPSSLTANVTYQLPTDGNANEILKTDGSGNLSFASAASLTQSGITDLVQDTTPELGGNLSVNNKSIISPSGNANINITPHGSGSVVLSGMEFPSSDGSANQILKTDGSNNLSWVTPYVHPNHSGEVTSTADGATVIASNIVDEENLKISNSPSDGKFLQYKDNTDELTWATPTDTNTTYSVVDSSANGLAPQLPGSHGGKFLKADGTWEVPPDTNTQVSIDDTPVDGVTNEAISSNWAYDHNAATGNGAHVPAAGSSGQFLKHDGTWGTPPDTDTTYTFGKSSGNALKSEEALTTDDVLLMGTSNVKGRTYAELKTDLSLNNVENTALSTWAGSSNITTVGTLTGATIDGSYKQVAEAVGALDIDLSTGNYFTKTISADSTFTFSNPAASGTVSSFTLELTHTSGTITWPTTVVWNGGVGKTAPTVATGKTHLFLFVTDSAGATYRGAVLADYDNAA